MKKNKLLWIVLPVSGILIVAVIVAAVLLISSQKKENRYYEQMSAAERYLEDMDYEKMIQAYETAIELKPEDPDAYIALAEYYLEQGKYYDAKSIAKKGYENTGSRRLEKMIGVVELSRVNQDEEVVQDVQVDSAIVEGEDSPKLLIRNNMFGVFGDYCYQQYINEYGDADIKYVSEEEGYQVKFKGLNAYAYFKDTPENSNAIDKTSKKPLPNAKPYKIVIQSPQLLFVGYDGYISSNKMSEMFQILPQSMIEQVDNTYYLVFEYLDCTIRIETDAEGNIYKSDPVIEMLPLNLISNWEEEEIQEVAEEEEEENPDTFVLAGEVYTYDITELIIFDETLSDLTPLAECKNLEYIALLGCTISDLSPLAGCTDLEELNLDGSRGNLDISCLAGLSNLRYLGFHECKDIDDISCIYGLELEILHPCGSSVSKEQCLEYQNMHPDCEVWFDYFYPIL